MSSEQLKKEECGKCKKNDGNINGTLQPLGRLQRGLLLWVGCGAVSPFRSSLSPVRLSSGSFALLRRLRGTEQRGRDGQGLAEEAGAAPPAALAGVAGPAPLP